ncbi:MAG TPA: condensation domain-containing protein, partial [Roseiflexaceae bacterium]|nr:condensation domain-containing protein [Roseiflexaceae bacterium]
MTIHFLIQQLRDRDITIWLEGDRLRYSASPGALTAELRAEIVERRDEVIAFLRSAAAATDQPAITPVPRSADMPLSFAQQRLWFLDQFTPGNPVYNVPLALELHGALDIAALERSLADLLIRHEALRTVFPESDGTPHQLILPPLPPQFQYIDLRGFAGDRAAELWRLLYEEARRPFDLARGPLLRALLIRSDETTYRLLLTMHHIVCDGRSLGVLANDLSLLYAGHTGGGAALPPLPLQYADYAVWQRNTAGPALERQLSYWQAQLGAGIPLLDLPIARPRPPVQAYRGAAYRFELEASLADRLRALARRSDATLFMVLLACLHTLLHRYSGQPLIAVGSPIAGRRHSEIEPLIGCFLNMLVLRATIDPEQPFSALLEQLRQTCLAAFANQDVPFEQIVETLQIERSLSHNPLFQVMLALQNTAPAIPQFAGVRAAADILDNGTAKFDLSLTFEERHGALAATLEYNSDLFDHAAIERLAGHYTILAAAAAADPATAIGALPLLSTAERHTLLVEWNATTADYPRE